MSSIFKESRLFPILPFCWKSLPLMVTLANIYPVLRKKEGGGGLMTMCFSNSNRINKLKNQTKYVLFLSWDKNFLLISKLLVWSIDLNLPRLFESFSGVINRESHVQIRKIWDKLTSIIFENSKSLSLYLTNFENFQKTQSINLFQILITHILWHKTT